MGFITKRVIPSEAIEAALKGADWAASASIRTAAISHDFNSLEACDDAVAEVRRWALGYAVTGGGAAGAFGALGLAFDVPRNDYPGAENLASDGALLWFLARIR